MMPEPAQTEGAAPLEAPAEYPQADELFDVERE